MRIYEKFKRFIKRFFLIDDTPHKIAAGAALGMFLGIIPGEGVLSTIFFSWLLRLNRLAALAGVIATNMWTTLAILPLAAALGGFLFHENSQKLVDNFYKNYHLGFKFFFSNAIFFDLVLPLIVGFILVAGAISAGFYFILYYLLKHKKIKFRP